MTHICVLGVLGGISILCAHDAHMRHGIFLPNLHWEDYISKFHAIVGGNMLNKSKSSIGRQGSNGKIDLGAQRVNTLSAQVDFAV